MRTGPSLPRHRALLLALLGCSFALVQGQTASLPAWTLAPGLRWHSLEPTGANRPGFTRLEPDLTGIAFTNRISELSVARNRIMENGSGVALGDVDGDGWCDIYLAGLEEENHLYRNLGGWHFEDITSRSGVACPGQFSTGASLADVDGDGDLDLLVNGIGVGTRLFLNNGQGQFQESTGSGLARSGGSHSLALADADGDGDLDLYVTNYRTTTWHDRPAGETREVKMINGKPVVKPADRWTALVSKPPGGVTLIELGEPDIYYLNDGHGHFSPVPWTDGTFADSQGQPLTEPPRDWGLSVLFRDLTGDGVPDLYVCNDFYFSRDRTWINDGHGRFRALPSGRLRAMCETSMAADIGDINRDGAVDLLVMDMLPRTHLARQTRWDNAWKQIVAAPTEDPRFSPEYPRNMLFLNRGDGTWAEIARFAGIEATGWSWSALFLDVDLDGYEDILVTTGSGRDMLHADVVRNTGPVPPGADMPARVRFSQKYHPLPLPNLAFRNQGDLTFVETGHNWGFDTLGVAHGMALADLDNDGDLDVVVNQYRDVAGVYRNDSPAPRVAVRLRAQPPNTQAIGAVVQMSGGLVPQSSQVTAGGRYLSGDDALRTFAADATGAELTIKTVWPGGLTTQITGVRANRLYEINEPTGTLPGQPPPARAVEATSASVFEDATALLHGQVHTDVPFDDFERQLLLPRKLSQPGPSVAWFDLNQDGWDDLVIGAGRGGPFNALLNAQGRGFQLVASDPLTCDQNCLFGWMAAADRPLLLATNSRYESPDPATPPVRWYDPRSAQAGTVADTFQHDPGALALGDWDADGDLDLFVAGRVVPGRYPEAASSRLYRNEKGTFVLDPDASKPFEQVGLVNGATFSDLNGDGFPDLILACEWGPIRVFANLHGKFVEQTAPLGLAQQTGLWQGIATGDFDGDGQLDLVATNLGRNGEYQPTSDRPLTAWAGDLDGNSTFEFLEAEWDDARGDWAPRRNLDSVATAAPFVRGTFTTSEAFGRATMKEIFGERLARAKQYHAATLDTSIFLARAGKFQRLSLPAEAQFSAAFGVAVGDFNGDAREDLFLAQNFFPVATDRSRQDAGTGLLLLGDGQGHFKSLSSAASGIRIDGEQRGCAVADFDGDGRLDLAVGQNRGATQLFRNRTAHPALRVRLSGLGGNPNVVGTQVAPVAAGGGRGLLREVRSGTGYLSQDSVVLLLPSPEAVRQLWIRWPRGKTVTVPVPDGAREVRVTGLGEVTLLH